MLNINAYITSLRFSFSQKEKFKIDQIKREIVYCTYIVIIIIYIGI